MKSVEFNKIIIMRGVFMKHVVKEFNEVIHSLDKLHVTDIKNPEHPSYYFKAQHYELFIIRFFELGESELKGISVPYLIKNGEIYKYNRNENNFIQLHGHTEFLNSLERHLQHSESIVKKYIEESDTLEDGLYTRKIPAIFLDVWFDLKKDLTRVDRILERAYEVLLEYSDIYAKSPDFPHEIFANIIEHIKRYQRLASLNAAKLDTLYSYYNSLKNDKINTNIYALTILSGVFLPLNLVVGFFGMNTENLFFSGNPEGTINVFTILIGMFLLLLILFPLVRMLEHYILQRVLGRFSLYNKLVGSIKKITTISE